MSKSATDGIAITRSHLDTLERCKRKFYYRYLAQVGEPASNQSMSEGTVLHEMLAQYFISLQEKSLSYADEVAIDAGREMLLRRTYEYRGEEHPLSPKLELYTETGDEAWERLQNVFKYWVENAAYNARNNAEIIAVEKNFAIERAGCTLEGVFDLVLLRTLPSGVKVLEVWDHKSVGSITNSLAVMALDVQTLVYETIVNELAPTWGIEYDSIELVWNYIRRQVPPGFGTRSLLTKSGKKSTASQNPADYLRIHRTSHSDEQLAAIATTLDVSLYEVLQRINVHSVEPDISKLASRTVIKSGGEACNRCPYFAQCSAELVGCAIPAFTGGEEPEDDGE